MSRTTGLVAGAGVLTTGSAVVVGSVARSVVVMVGAFGERVVRRTVGESAADTHATERHGDGVARRVATAHRLAPAALSHNNSFWSWAEKINPPQSGASI